ncbi:hypothetical protein U1Q18_000966 [Sarracenia purpurea var. burkii]
MLRWLKEEGRAARGILAGIVGGSRWIRSKHTVVMSFGDGSQGALGLPTSVVGTGGDAYEPTSVPGLPPDVSTITAGHYHSLAVTSQGEIWAWGRNHEAQLGRGLLAPRESWNEPKRVEGLGGVRVRAAFASGVISTAIGDDGSLWVWGKSKRGQLGLGKGVTESVSPYKVEVLAGEEIVKVSLGWGHALALTKDGKLFGWGYSADGRLGQMGKPLEHSPLDSSSDRLEATQLSSSIVEAAEKLVLEGIEKEKDMPIIWEPCLIKELCDFEVVDVACGLDHSLVLCRDGTLLSSGSNIYGQLGRAIPDLGMQPVDISFHPVSIASGLGHSLAICHIEEPEGTGGSAARIVSWGWNQSSQLGRKGPENLPLVVEEEEMAGEIPVSVSGGRAHSMALTSKAELWVWGSGRNGRLGLGCSIDEAEPKLVEYLEGDEVLQAVSGFDHNLVLIGK